MIFAKYYDKNKPSYPSLFLFRSSEVIGYYIPYSNPFESTQAGFFIG